MIFIYAAALTAVNTVWLALNLLGLPGNWLMVGTTVALAWWLGDERAFHAATLVTIAGLALVGEVLEFMLSAAGAAKSGSTRRGAIGAVLGAVVGGIVGTFMIPVPIVGSILGACGGAFAGAMLLELSGGRGVGHAARIGHGAAVGRLWGTIAKLSIGAAIWVVATVAAFWP